jgi:hypothetical protein
LTSVRKHLNKITISDTCSIIVFYQDILIEVRYMYQHIIDLYIRKHLLKDINNVLRFNAYLYANLCPPRYFCIHVTNGISMHIQMCLIISCQIAVILRSSVIIVNVHIRDPEILYFFHCRQCIRHIKFLM